MKRCTSCNILKPLTEFWFKRVNKDQKDTRCILCLKKHNKEKYLRNRTKRCKEAKKYRSIKKTPSSNKKCYKCKEIKSINLFYKSKCQKDGYVSICTECEKTRKQTLKYKQYKTKYRKSYEKIKYKTDSLFKLKHRLRKRLYDAIKNNFKSGSAVKDLGCTIEQLKQHLEKQFQSGMTWDNWSYTGWHIDHIRPLASFDLTDRAQLLQACHYTNLQPLWHEDHKKKTIQDNILFT